MHQRGTTDKHSMHQNKSESVTSVIIRNIIYTVVIIVAYYLHESPIVNVLTSINVQNLGCNVWEYLHLSSPRAQDHVLTDMQWHTLGSNDCDCIHIGTQVFCPMQQGDFCTG